MKNKPVWLLDVDGVINACPDVGEKFYPSTFPAETWNLVWGTALHKQYPIRFSTEVIDTINELSERAEIRWHTTWQADAPALGELLGLKTFDVVDTSAYFRQKFSGYINTSPFKWWKMQAGLEVVNKENRPLIWTDDDLGFEWRRVLETDATNAVSTCLIQPYTETGLTREDLTSIEQFISEIESR